MQFMRLGQPGAERPAVRADEGQLFDLTPLTRDIDGAFFEQEGTARSREALAAGRDWSQFLILDTVEWEPRSLALRLSCALARTTRRTPPSQATSLLPFRSCSLSIQTRSWAPMTT